MWLIGGCCVLQVSLTNIERVHHHTQVQFWYKVTFAIRKYRCRKKKNCQCRLASLFDAETLRLTSVWRRKTSLAIFRRWGGDLEFLGDKRRQGSNQLKSIGAHQIGRVMIRRHQNCTETWVYASLIWEFAVPKLWFPKLKLVTGLKQPHITH